MAASASKVTAICAACLWPGRSPSSVTPRSMARGIGPGSQPCWRGGRPRLHGEKTGAVTLLRNAADALEAIPFAEHAARLRRKLADVYCDLGDPDAAIVELRRVHEVFARLRAGPALDDTREKLRALGARPPARTAAAGIGAMSGREIEIAQLVAARKTNKEIGETLGISSRTVSTHLSNVFRKAGVDSRGALTDLVRSGAFSVTAS